jgi:hypothetical protein
MNSEKTSVKYNTFNGIMDSVIIEKEIRVLLHCAWDISLIGSSALNSLGVW